MGRGRERGLQHLLSAGRATQQGDRLRAGRATDRAHAGAGRGRHLVLRRYSVDPDHIQNPASRFGGGGGGIGAGVEGSSGSRLYHLRLCGTQS